MNRQITTISFFKFSSLQNKIWAVVMMLLAHKDLYKVKGLSFYRLMGSGKDKGFNPLPDWSVYSLIQVWKSEEAANEFFNRSKLIKKYKNHTKEMYTLYIAIITRATIKLSWLFRFWKYVPTSQEPLDGNKGLIYTKGIGEVPVVQMATFSLWKNFNAVKEYAYKSKQHKDAIRKTRKNKWYKEELFSRFHPYKSLGTWDDNNQLIF